MAVQTIFAEAVLKGCVRKEFAWQILSDFSKFPSIMKSVDKVTILESSGDRGVSEWFISVDNAPLRWIEKDRFDHKNYEITFESIDGDFESIRGVWKVEDYNCEGIKLSLSMEYVLGIPVIEDVVGEILKEKMKKNIGFMLEAIKSELDKPMDEDRKFQRYSVNAYTTLAINDREVRTNVANISQGGMMFTTPSTPLPAEALVLIDNVLIKAEMKCGDQSRAVARAIFNEEISPLTLERALRWLMTKNARFHSRKIIESDVVLESDEKNLAVHLVNISRSGMLVSYQNYYEGIEGTFTLCGIPVVLREVNHNAMAKNISVKFAEPLGDLDFAAILTILENLHEEKETLQVA